MPPHIRIDFATNIGRRKIFNILQANNVSAFDLNEDFILHSRLYPMKNPDSLGSKICKSLHIKVDKKNVHRLSQRLKEERLYYKKMLEENCFSELKNNSSPVKKEDIGSSSKSSKTYSVSSRDVEKCNTNQNGFMKVGQTDDLLTFMDLVRSLLLQYPQISQLEMQKKIINDLYDGLMDNKDPNK